MDNLKHLEIELKFPLLNRLELIEKLKSIAKLEKSEELQKDTYYNPAHRNFLSKKPVSEWLRLRESKKGFSLNYKKWHNEDGNKTISCDEFETKIENIESLKKLFENLNFEETIIIEKNRSVWHYKDTEIAIDDVKDLGNFIEIEAKGNFINIGEAKKHLYLILNELGAKIGEQDFEGYPYLLLKKNGLL
jgi:adenylate cyclase class 2